MNEDNIKKIEEHDDIEKKCHDCCIDIKIDNNEIVNGVLLKYKDGDEDICIYKCNECYEKNASLANYNKCEVYSRVVGYYRPVQQWNKGKAQEYSERTEFNYGKEYL